MYGDFFALNSVFETDIRVYVWFWLTQLIYLTQRGRAGLQAAEGCLLGSWLPRGTGWISKLVVEDWQKKKKRKNANSVNTNGMD
jgi:hypothetical protein